MKSKLILLLLFVGLISIGFSGYANAEPDAKIYPVKSSGMQSVPGGYMYFYDFDMDTFNQTVSIGSVEFIINNTDTTLYEIGKSSVGVEGHSDLIPLAGIGEILHADNIIWFYDYPSLDLKPMIFTPESKDQTAKFTLSLFTPNRIYENLGVSVKVHYITKERNQIEHIVSSDWLSIQDSNISLTEGTNVCTVGYDCKGIQFGLTASEGKPVQDQNQQILDALNVIKQQNAVLILEQAQYNRIGAYNYCATYFIGIHDLIWSNSDFVKCVKDVLDGTK